MTTTKTTETPQTGQGDLDDLPGTYTLDDGHTGSYDHEAAVSVGDSTVTVACSCGQWTQTGDASVDEEGDTVLLPVWKRHVYKATGRVYGHPLEEVQRVDALNCQAPAAHRVGDRLVCTTHRLEVLHAYWEADSSTPLFEVDEAAGYRCGETFPGVSR